MCCLDILDIGELLLSNNNNFNKSIANGETFVRTPVDKFTVYWTGWQRENKVGVLWLWTYNGKMSAREISIWLESELRKIVCKLFTLGQVFVTGFYIGRMWRFCLILRDLALETFYHNSIYA